MLFGFLQEFFFDFEVFDDGFHDEVGAVDAAEVIGPIHSREGLGFFSFAHAAFFNQSAKDLFDGSAAASDGAWVVVEIHDIAPLLCGDLSNSRAHGTGS